MLGQLKLIGKCTNGMIVALSKNTTIWKCFSDLHKMMKKVTFILDFKTTGTDIFNNFLLTDPYALRILLIKTVLVLNEEG